MRSEPVVGPGGACPSGAGPTVSDCLRACGLPRLEAQLLLAQVLKQSRVWLITHDDAVLSQEQHQGFLALCARRFQGEPIAYLLGQREFMGLTFEVSPAVLIPRPETELLVTEALRIITHKSSPAILDLGTGSGAIAVALAHARTDARVWATDISADALDLARRNALKHGVSVAFLQGSWFDALVSEASLPKFDVMVSNPPYIAAGDGHLREGDLRFEPTLALTDGADGLDAYRAILSRAPQYLSKGASVCLEHGFDQSGAVSLLFEQAGFVDIKTLRDLAGHPRVTAGSYNGDQID